MTLLLRGQRDLLDTALLSSAMGLIFIGAAIICLALAVHPLRSTERRRTTQLPKVSSDELARALDDTAE